jgi:cysteine desulfurase
MQALMRQLSQTLLHAVRQVIPERRYYCDYAAATPLAPQVARLMNRIQRRHFGNPSAVHQAGGAAAQVIADSRLTLARTLGVRPAEVTFTASGTEANNLAILGLIEGLVATGRAYHELSIVTTMTEHPSVLAVVAELAKRGVRVDHVAVDEAGVISLAELEARLAEPITLFTCSYANSEVGMVQPVRRITRLIRRLQPATVIHLDAAQASLWLPCNRHQLGVDMLTLDAGKCNGPKGVGVLVAGATHTLVPIMRGGGQERGRRAGTENTAGIAGAAAAIVAAQQGAPARRSRVHATSLALASALRRRVPNVVFNGPDLDVATEELMRLPNNVHISLPGLDTEYAVVYLDTHGIAASTKSACSGAGGGMSETVFAMTGDRERASSTIRFSLDPRLKPADVEYIAQTLAHFCTLQSSVD